MRDNRGRFVKGNPGGPGNPKMRSLTEQAKRIRALVTDEDLERVVRRLVELAEGGDAQACKLVLERLAGKAPQPPEPELDLDLVDVQGCADLAENARRIATAVASGRISPTQGEQALHVFQMVGAALERADIEARVDALENERAARMFGIEV